MHSAEQTRSMPSWLLPGLIVVAVLAIGLVAWHELMGGTAAGPARTVHPGMYDFRKEAQSGNLGRRQDTR